MNLKLRSLSLIASLSILTIFNSNAQTVSDFENFSLGTDTFDNGISTSLGHTFSSGNADFENYYDTAWGGYWSQGWGMSTVEDTLTAGFTNLFGCAVGEGYNSNTYAVGQNFARVALTGDASGKLVSGLYVTNTTYAALSMRDGDGFAKQFGGSTGNDSDWFKLNIIGTLNGSITDTVEFYLADYRFGDNTQDYIVKSWEWVDLTALGNVDTVHFQLSSSDAGANGINTPTFFAIDDLTTMDSGLNLEEKVASNLSVYPNPTNGIVNIGGMLDGSYEMFSISGTKVSEGSITDGRMDVSHLPTSVYVLKIQSKEGISTRKLSIK